MAGNKTPWPERFWQKVDKRSPDGCWPWVATKNNKGYGMAYAPEITGGQEKRLAHRVSYIMAFGPISPNVCVLHRCDNPPCVNPAHLFLGTKKENMQDALAKGRTRYATRRGDSHPQRQDPSKVLRGERNGNAKLNALTVVGLRKRLALGTPLRQLARETGLNRKTLMHMRDRKSWKHIP